MSVAGTLALAVVVAPAETRVGSPPPKRLVPALESALAAGWRALEVVLAGQPLRARSLATASPPVRDSIDAMFAIASATATRERPLGELHRARGDGALAGAIEPATLVHAAATHEARSATTAVARMLSAAGYRELASALGEPELAALVVDAARAGFRHFAANDPALAAWAIGPTGVAHRDRGLIALADLLASPVATAELDALIAPSNPLAHAQTVPQPAVTLTAGGRPDAFAPTQALPVVGERSPPTSGSRRVAIILAIVAAAGLALTAGYLTR